MSEPKFSDLAVLMRLEVARLVKGSPIWFLLDWVKDERELTKEMMRILERFNRLTLSLTRQQSGRRARNEPYADVIGVRAKMGPRIIGVWPKGPHERQLLNARTATASEHIIESQFATWLASRRQVGSAPPAPREQDASKEK